MEHKVLSFLQHIPGDVFQQDNAHAHDVLNVQAFFRGQHIRIFPWLACSPDMSPTEPVWIYIGQRLTRITRQLQTTIELWDQRQAIWNGILQRDRTSVTSCHGVCGLSSLRVAPHGVLIPDVIFVSLLALLRNYVNDFLFFT